MGLLLTIIFIFIGLQGIIVFFSLKYHRYRLSAKSMFIAFSKLVGTLFWADFFTPILLDAFIYSDDIFLGYYLLLFILPMITVYFLFLPNK